MGTLLHGANVSEAWLQALDYLLQAGGTAVHLTVEIARPDQEDTGVRRAVDDFIRERRLSNSRNPVPSIQTVANTIFPEALYHPRLGATARAHLYKMTERARRVSRRKNKAGTYFERLVAWPNVNDEFNQLDRTIERLRARRLNGVRNGNAFEMGLEGLDPDDADQRTAALPIYSPGRDNKILGFPCLSHISLTLDDGRVHMAALYRNHHFIRRAYGNYLGLGRLLSFIARESGWEMGELLCVSTHADAEIGQGAGFGYGALQALAQQCRGAASETGEVSPVEGRASL